MASCISPVAINKLSYTDEQAVRGRKIYLEHCVLCHGTNLMDAQFGAPLRGGYFKNRWEEKTAAELYTVTSVTMPPDKPNSLSVEEYADVLAFILKANEVQPGSEKFPTNQERLLQIKISWENKGEE